MAKPSPSILFLTATGTGLGKTALSAALLIWASRMGLRPAYVKPVQAGPGDDGATGDAEWVKSRIPDGIPCTTLVSLNQPASPHWAAQREGVTLDPARLIDGVRIASRERDLVVVEGSGGLAAPLNAQGLTLAEIALWEDWHPLLVSAPGLGTLSHTRTAYAYALQLGLRLRAFCFSRSRAQDESPESLAMESENARLLHSLTGMDFLGALAHGAAATGLAADRASHSNRELSSPLEQGFLRFWESLR